jgi:predicted RNase H-like HicB family nuclease
VLLVDRAGEGHGEAVGLVRYDSRRYTGAMTFRIVLEYDAEARAFSAVCPELPGCASAGDTEEEARRNIKEAIELYLEPSDIELPQDAKVAEVTVG